jgi:hypothetical protein
LDTPSAKFPPDIVGVLLFDNDVDRPAFVSATSDDLINGGEGDDTLFETIAADIVLTNRRMTGLGTDRIRGLETAEFAVMDNAEVDGERFSGSINLDPIDADFETDD